MIWLSHFYAVLRNRIHLPIVKPYIQRRSHILPPIALADSKPTKARSRLITHLVKYLTDAYEKNLKLT